MLLLGPHELFRALGESMNSEFYAWSRSCCLGALALYWFASEKRKESLRYAVTRACWEYAGPPFPALPRSVDPLGLHAFNYAVLVAYFPICDGIYVHIRICT